MAKIGANPTPKSMTPAQTGAVDAKKAGKPSGSKLSRLKGAIKEKLSPPKSGGKAKAKTPSAPTHPKDVKPASGPRKGMSPAAVSNAPVSGKEGRESLDILKGVNGNGGKGKDVSYNDKLADALGREASAGTEELRDEAAKTALSQPFLKGLDESKAAEFAKHLDTMLTGDDPVRVKDANAKLQKLCDEAQAGVGAGDKEALAEMKMAKGMLAGIGERRGAEALSAATQNIHLGNAEVALAKGDLAAAGKELALAREAAVPPRPEGLKAFADDAAVQGRADRADSLSRRLDDAKLAKSDLSVAMDDLMKQAADPKRLGGASADGVGDIDKSMAPILEKLQQKLDQDEQIPGEHKFLSDKWSETQTTFLATSAIRANNQAIAGKSADELQRIAGDFSKTVAELKASPSCPEQVKELLDKSLADLEDACVAKTVDPHLAEIKTIGGRLADVEGRLETSPKMAKDERKELNKSLDAQSGRLDASLAKLESERDALAKEMDAARAGGKKPDPAAEKRLAIMDKRLEAGRKAESGYADARAQASLLKRKSAIQERGKGDVVTPRSLANTEADIRNGALETKDRDALKAKLAGGGGLSQADRDTVHAKLDAVLTGKQKAALGEAFAGLRDPEFTPTPEQATALSRALDRTHTPEAAESMLADLAAFSAESRDAMLAEMKDKVAAAKSDNGALINLGPRLDTLGKDAARLLSAEDRKTVEDGLVAARKELEPAAAALALGRCDDAGREAYAKLDDAGKQAFGELCSKTLNHPEVGADLLASDDPSAALKALAKGGGEAVDALDKLMLARPENDDLCLELKAMYNGDGDNAVAESALGLKHDSARTTRDVRTLMTGLADSKDIKPEAKQELERLLALPDGEMYDGLVAHLAEDKIDAAPGDFSACDLMILRGAHQHRLASDSPPKDFAEFQASLPKPYNDARARPNLAAELNSGYASSSTVNLAGGALKATSKAVFLNTQLRSALKSVALTPEKRAAEAVMRNKLTNLMGFKGAKNKDLDTLLAEAKGDGGKLLLDANLAKPGVKNAVLNGLQGVFGLKDDSAKLAFRDQLDAMEGKAKIAGKLGADITAAQGLDSSALDEARSTNVHLGVLSDLSKGIGDKGKQFVVDGSVKASKLPNPTMTMSLATMDSLVKNHKAYGDWQTQKNIAGSLQYPKHMNFATMQGSDSSGRFSSVKADTPEGREFRAIRDKMAGAKNETDFNKARAEMGAFLDGQKVGDKTAALLYAAPVKPGEGGEYIQKSVGKALGKAGAAHADAVAKQMTRERIVTVGGQKRFESLEKTVGKTHKQEGKALGEAEKAAARAVSVHVAEALDDAAMVAVMKRFRDGGDGDFKACVAAAGTKPSLAREACVNDIKDILGCSSEVAEYALDHCLKEKIGGKTDLDQLAKDNGLSLKNQALRAKDIMDTPYEDLSSRDKKEIENACHIMAESVGPGKGVVFDSEAGIEIGVAIPLDSQKLNNVNLGFQLAAKNGLAIVGNPDGSIDLNLVDSANAGVNVGISALKGFVTANAGVNVEGGAGFSFHFVDDEKGTAKEKLEKFTGELFTGRAGAASFGHASSVSTIVKAGGGFEAGAKLDATKLADFGLNKALEPGLEKVDEIVGKVKDKVTDAVVPDIFKSDDDGGDEEKKPKAKTFLVGRVKVEASASFSVQGEYMKKYHPDGSETRSLGFSAKGSVRGEIGVEQAQIKKGLQKALGGSGLKGHISWQAGGEVTRTVKNGKLTAASMTMTKEFRPGEVDSPDKAEAIARGMGITNETLLKDLRTMVENGVPVSLSVQGTLRPDVMERMNSGGFNERDLFDSDLYDTDELTLTYDTSSVKKELKLGFDTVVKLGGHIQATGTTQGTVTYSHRE